MANYVCNTRTNYFRVTDEAKYQELFSKLDAPDDFGVQDFTEVVDGKKYHGFGASGTIGYYADEDDPDDDGDMEPFFREMVKILPEDDAFMLFEAGHEKLRYLVGHATVVTHNGIRYNNMQNWALTAARDMLGNPDFTTNTDY